MKINLCNSYQTFLISFHLKIVNNKDLTWCYIKYRVVLLCGRHRKFQTCGIFEFLFILIGCILIC